MEKENEKRGKTGSILMLIAILISVLIFIWYVIFCLHSEGNLYESSKVDKDMQGINYLVTAAQAAYSVSKDRDASEVYVIEFTEDGYEIYGKNNGRNATGITRLENDFSVYAGGEYEALSLAGIRKEASSVRFSKLDQFIITIDEARKLVSFRCSFRGKKFEEYYYEIEMNGQ